MAVLAGALLLLAGCESRTTVVTSPDPGGISVTGSGTVTVTPDIAQLSVGVEARAATIAEVRAVAARAQEAVLASLKANGIQDREIQTQGLNIRPEYGTRPFSTPATPAPTTPSTSPPSAGGSSGPSIEPSAPSRVPAPPTFPGEPVIVAYVMTNTVSVKIRNLESASKVVDEAIAAGGDVVRLDGISFTVDDPERFATQARELAVKDARDRAESLAKLAGVQLGKPRSINEFLGGPIAGKGGFATPAAADVATPISPGEADLTMQVNIVYEVR